MDVKIVGYYTSNACYVGKPDSWDSSISQVLVKDEEGNVRLISPDYLPNILPPIFPSQVEPAPPFPKIHCSYEEIEAMSRGREAYGPKALGLKKLPEDVKEIRRLLLKADREGMIVWAEKSDLSPVYRLIQNAIDNASGDMHVVVGYNHEIEAQIKFINELVFLGEDGLKIDGITQLVLEMYGTEEAQEKDVPCALEVWKTGNRLQRQKLYEHDLQAFIDHYLKTKDDTIMLFFQGYIHSVATFRCKGCEDAQVEILRIAADSNYRVIAGDLSIAERVKLNGLVFGVRYTYAAREAFGVDNARRYLFPGGKNVLLYVWGLEHIEKEGLAKHIKYKDPQSTVVSIAVHGGAFQDLVYFDWALQEMGKEDSKWTNKAFVLVLKDFREADFVVHLPNENRRHYYDSGYVRKSPLIVFDR